MIRAGSFLWCCIVKDNTNYVFLNETIPIPSPRRSSEEWGESPVCVSVGRASQKGNNFPLLFTSTVPLRGK